MKCVIRTMLCLRMDFILEFSCLSLVFCLKCLFVIKSNCVIFLNSSVSLGGLFIKFILEHGFFLLVSPVLLFSSRFPLCIDFETLHVGQLYYYVLQKPRCIFGSKILYYSFLMLICFQNMNILVEIQYDRSHWICMLQLNNHPAIPILYSCKIKITDLNI